MHYVTGNTIKQLREKRGMTQKELAEIINMSDKTISKWETSRGLPDITVIADLAKALGVSIAELLTGDFRENTNQSANMKKMLFYVCPICGNIVTSVGAGTFSCCGITLLQQEAEQCDANHDIKVEVIDHEYFVTVQHAMSKDHYISFVAYITSGSFEMVKLYPEQDIAVRFYKQGHGILLAYCNKHGLFQVRV